MSYISSESGDLADKIEQMVKTALQEDIGDGDLTAALLEPVPAKAEVVCREPAILCGTAWFDQVFAQVDTEITIDWHYQDGDKISEDSLVCTLRGPVTSILTGERTALNFLQTLSATATTTAAYVNKVSGTKAKILDTRKTIPGLRRAQKYAVSCGGGINHRMGLYDAILIKENHIAVTGSIKKAISRAKDKYPDIFIEVEVENMDEFERATTAEPDRILLDNFSVEMLKQATAFDCGCNQLEASGNITLDNVAEIAATGVDFISVGGLTKNIKAVDLSLRIR